MRAEAVRQSSNKRLVQDTLMQIQIQTETHSRYEQMEAVHLVMPVSCHKHPSPSIAMKEVLGDERCPGNVNPDEPTLKVMEKKKKKEIRRKARVKDLQQFSKEKSKQFYTFIKHSNRLATKRAEEKSRQTMHEKVLTQRQAWGTVSNVDVTDAGKKIYVAPQQYALENEEDYRRDRTTTLESLQRCMHTPLQPSPPDHKLSKSKASPQRASMPTRTVQHISHTVSNVILEHDSDPISIPPTYNCIPLSFRIIMFCYFVSLRPSRSFTVFRARANRSPGEVHPLKLSPTQSTFACRKREFLESYSSNLTHQVCTWHLKIFILLCLSALLLPCAPPSPSFFLLLRHHHPSFPSFPSSSLLSLTFSSIFQD